jgi:hypothetical protein
MAITAGLITVFLLAFLLIRRAIQQNQMQSDPEVATVWELGVTRGAQQDLKVGNGLQRWLNAHGLHVLGRAATYHSRYQGDTDGLEIWFDYESHVKGQAPLECHRVGETAFMDDLGQPYHGMLDLHDHVVGVYLPGYDHAARRLMCALHWMPRRPSRPSPVSRPMMFVVDLPPAKRVLPARNALPRGPIIATQNGITVTVMGARLSPPNLSIFHSSQRELTLSIAVQGGVLADSNAGFTALNPVVSRATRMAIYDPYGQSLIPAGLPVLPQSEADDLRPPTRAGETVFIAPVNGAGRGTDVVKVHIDVRPDGTTLSVPFDLLVPVDTEEEV